MDLIPGQEIKIPYATQDGLNLKKFKKKKKKRNAKKVKVVITMSLLIKAPFQANAGNNFKQQ